MCDVMLYCNMVVTPLTTMFNINDTYIMLQLLPSLMYRKLLLLLQKIITITTFQTTLTVSHGMAPLCVHKVDYTVDLHDTVDGATYACMSL